MKKIEWHFLHSLDYSKYDRDTFNKVLAYAEEHYNPHNDIRQWLMWIHELLDHATFYRKYADNPMVSQESVQDGLDFLVGDVTDVDAQKLVDVGITHWMYFMNCDMYFDEFIKIVGVDGFNKGIEYLKLVTGYMKDEKGIDC